MGGLFKVSSGGTGAGEIPITDPVIIATIILPANWNDSGAYTGSLVGLVTGNVHYDGNWKQRIYYDGTTLRRSNYNQLIN